MKELNTKIEEEILEFIDGPTKREEIESNIEFPDEEIQETLREMLYAGILETTPDWQYEKK
jgi:hypothetical protein